MDCRAEAAKCRRKGILPENNDPEALVEQDIEEEASQDTDENLVP